MFSCEYCEIFKSTCFEELSVNGFFSEQYYNLHELFGEVIPSVVVLLLILLVFKLCLSI